VKYEESRRQLMEMFRKRQADLAAKAAKGAPDATGAAPQAAGQPPAASASPAAQKKPAPATP
jgi:hypothetical protein